MKIILIAAVDRNGALGANGTLPWHCPQDLKHFRNLTTGKCVLMGRKTADSLSKPLRDRINMVLTRSKNPYPRPGFITVRNKRDIKRVLRANNQDELWVIGGGAVYDKYIKEAQTVHLTQLDIEVPDADTWFPMQQLASYRGCMAQTSVDPKVHFWVFTRNGVPTVRQKPHGMHIQMDLNCPIGVVVKDCSGTHRYIG